MCRSPAQPIETDRDEAAGSACSIQSDFRSITILLISPQPQEIHNGLLCARTALAFIQLWDGCIPTHPSTLPFPLHSICGAILQQKGCLQHRPPCARTPVLFAASCSKSSASRTGGRMAGFDERGRSREGEARCMLCERLVSEGFFALSFVQCNGLERKLASGLCAERRGAPT